jgi:hypothetical protein
MLRAEVKTVSKVTEAGKVATIKKKVTRIGIEFYRNQYMLGSDAAHYLPNMVTHFLALRCGTRYLK